MILFLFSTGRWANWKGNPSCQKRILLRRVINEIRATFFKRTGKIFALTKTCAVKSTKYFFQLVKKESKPYLNGNSEPSYRAIVLDKLPLPTTGGNVVGESIKIFSFLFLNYIKVSFNDLLTKCGHTDQILFTFSIHLRWCYKNTISNTFNITFCFFRI